MLLESIFKIAGVDPTKGKAKKLLEQDMGHGVCIWSDNQVYNIADLPSTATTDDVLSALSTMLDPNDMEAMSDAPGEGQVLTPNELQAARPAKTMTLAQYAAELHRAFQMNG